MKSPAPAPEKKRKTLREMMSATVLARRAPQRHTFRIRRTRSDVVLASTGNSAAVKEASTANIMPSTYTRNKRSMPETPTQPQEQKGTQESNLIGDGDLRRALREASTVQHEITDALFAATGDAVAAADVAEMRKELVELRQMNAALEQGRRAAQPAHPAQPAQPAQSAPLPSPAQRQPTRKRTAKPRRHSSITASDVQRAVKEANEARRAATRAAFSAENRDQRKRAVLGVRTPPCRVQSPAAVGNAATVNSQSYPVSPPLPTSPPPTAAVAATAASTQEGSKNRNETSRQRTMRERRLAAAEARRTGGVSPPPPSVPVPALHIHDDRHGQALPPSPPRRQQQQAPTNDCCSPPLSLRGEEHNNVERTSPGGSISASSSPAKSRKSKKPKFKLYTRHLSLVSDKDVAAARMRMASGPGGSSVVLGLPDAHGRAEAQKRLPQSSLVAPTGIVRLSQRNKHLTWWEPSINARVPKLSALVSVDLSCNLLVTIPMSVGLLTGLTELYLNNNKIFWLPSELGSLSNLEVLRLNDNSLGELPSSIGRLSNLKLLHAARNLIEKLPASIGQLKRLEEIGLSRNLLRKLPDEFGGLRSLKKLILDENDLESLPMSVGRLGKLCKVNLNGNRLRKLPTSIGGLARLREMFVERNHLVDPPHQIVNVPDWKRASLVVEYFKSRHFSLPWSRQHHPVFGATCNSVLFTSIVSGNRLVAEVAKSDPAVWQLPPEIWDYIFQFLTGSSFVGNYADTSNAKKHPGNPVGIAAVAKRPAPADPAAKWMKNWAWM